MAVHKADRAAVRKIIAQQGRLMKNKKRLVAQMLKLKARAQVLLNESSGLQTSIDDIERQLDYNQASLRGYADGA